MKFSETWLRSLVNPPLSTASLAHALTMGGLEVESLEPVAPPFQGVVVGQICSVEKHPQADRLKLLTVDIGAPERLQVVCGAPDVTVGMKAPCALVGATLPGGLVIKAAKVRGMESFGMMCSEKELGLPETDAGLLVLAPDAIPGTDIRAWLDLDDHVFTLKLTPNRADCLGLLGVAREVSALTGTPLSSLETTPWPVSGKTTRQVRVRDVRACPRYLGRSLRLEHPDCPTPEWMVRRLLRSGLRPKGLAVDVTNYVLLELGQPLHAFNESCLEGNLEVRWAHQGETLVLLNGQALELAPDMLVIADETGPVALAGVMGGRGSAVADTSRGIFLEAAFFAPEAIAGRARRATLASDSAYRFERGVDFEATRRAMERATSLLLELAGGEAGEIMESVADLPLRSPVLVRPARVRRMLGLDLPDVLIGRLLQRQGFKPEPVGEGFRVTSPSYRFDLAMEADYVEEVARLYGYDEIPASPPSGQLRLLPQPEGRATERELGQILVHRGYQEVVTYSFVDARDEAALSASPSDVALLNPLSVQYSVMRSTLACGLLNTLRYNLNRKQERIRVFELGRCFRRGAAQDFVQSTHIGGLVYGLRHPEQWGQLATPADFFDLKGDVEALLPAGEARFDPLSDHPALHPGRAAVIAFAGKNIGWMGELHPEVAARYELPSAPFLFEMEVDGLLPRTLPTYLETSRFQPIRRDLAVIVDASVPAGDMIDALRNAGIPGVSDFGLFDLYQGSGVPDGKKSLAFRIVMQDTERTFTEMELESVVAGLLQLLRDRFKAELR